MNNLRVWMHGLVAAAIGGAATAVGTFLAQGAQADAKSIGRSALIGAALTTAGYLKQSPLPPSNAQLITLIDKATQKTEAETCTNGPTGKTT